MVTCQICHITKDFSNVSKIATSLFGDVRKIRVLITINISLILLLFFFFFVVRDL
jgi:hypothetical protein